MLAQVSREKAFDYLRTKLQLGYLVWSGLRDSVSSKGYPRSEAAAYETRYRIIIQSERPPTQLDEKIELFLHILRQSIVEMSPGDYAAHVSSLVLSLSETPKHLGKETGRYWTHIDSGFYEFNQSEIN